MTAAVGSRVSSPNTPEPGVPHCMTAAVGSRTSPPESAAPANDLPWCHALQTAIRDPIQLCRALQLPPSCEANAVQASRAFTVLVPRGYLARMHPGDPHDPLLRQVLPRSEELQETTGFVRDPVEDHVAQRCPGLLHKYHGRALMITTGACAVHCRYCFRRHYPYSAAVVDTLRTEAIAQVAADRTIEEVILSGGDPLLLDDNILANLATQLAEIPHLHRLRIHSRLPVVIPERVTQALVNWLRSTRLTPIMVVQANHPHELDDGVARALGRLVDAGIPVLNQAVLLRGVNDHDETLAELCRRLVDCRVQPYYLHQLDRVTGAAHFEVDPEEGVRLIQQLRARLPGYAVPRYVREVPGTASKVVLA